MAKGTAIVVGASSGIGKAIALQLAADGWKVGVTARRLGNLDEVAVRLGPSAARREIDLDQPEAARLDLRAFAEALGGVDLWVLNAGTGVLNPDFDWEPERQTIATNVLGFAAMADAAVHHCLARGRGRIIGISSVAKLRGHPRTVGYSASKAFVSLYLDGIRQFLRRRGPAISVTEAAPGYVATPLQKFEEAFWVASPELAARQIIAAGLKRRKHAWVPRRWAPIAALLALAPR
ncbi:MAG: SDR family NAD(P)-dependent oxidoreductase [Pseudomonadota bacterium]